MATPSLELETGSGAIGAGEPGNPGRWRGWVIPLGALLFGGRPPVTLLPGTA